MDRLRHFEVLSYSITILDRYWDINESMMENSFVPYTTNITLLLKRALSNEKGTTGNGF